MSQTLAEHEAAREFLVASGLMSDDEPAQWGRLTGGVSSDLWRVDLPGRTLCVKSALAQLRVSDRWQAPVSRNAVEHDWLRFAGGVVPGHVPEVLAHDVARGFFAMEFLDPADHPVWKSQLMRGEVDPSVAEEVGAVLGSLHAHSANDPALARTFATDENFEALRLRPYLRVTAERDPLVAGRLLELAERTAGCRVAVVHGDVSPKNILVGPHGPVLLDAECAWYGDPAFDVAFCLTHLALKPLVRPEAAEALAESASRLLSAYAAHIDWEDPSALALRAGSLLPALLLARVDGASPVEYLTAPGLVEHVRDRAVAMLQAPAEPVSEAFTRWLSPGAWSPPG